MSNTLGFIHWSVKKMALENCSKKLIEYGKGIKVKSTGVAHSINVLLMNILNVETTHWKMIKKEIGRLTVMIVMFVHVNDIDLVENGSKLIIWNELVYGGIVLLIWECIEDNP